MRKFFTILLANLILFLVANAQTSEPISELTPVVSNIGKFSKQLPRIRNRIINRDNLKFEISTKLANLANNKKGISVEIKTFYNELVFQPIADKQTARLKIYGRITSEDKFTDGFFEEIVSEGADINDLVKGINKGIILRKVFDLPKGNYQIGAIVTDISSGIRGVKVLKFEIL